MTCAGAGSDMCTACPGSLTHLDGGDGIGVCESACEDGSFRADVDGASSCEACHSRCETCMGSGEDECLSCAEELFLSGRECLSGCPAGTYEDGRVCRHCQDTHCAVCGENGAICFQCSGGFSLLDGECTFACLSDMFGVDP